MCLLRLEPYSPKMVNCFCLGDDFHDRGNPTWVLLHEQPSRAFSGHGRLSGSAQTADS